MEPLGYARWENFRIAIQRAVESCETTGYKAENHFRGVTKMVNLGSGLFFLSVLKVKHEKLYIRILNGLSYLQERDDRDAFENWGHP